MRLHEAEPGAGHAALALLTSERSRARGLLDSLAQGPQALAPAPDPSLEARLRRAEERLAEAQQARLSATGAPAVAALDRELRRLSAELDRLRTVSRLPSGAPAPSSQEPALRLEELQALLDEDTVLLEVFLGEQRSFLWLVGRRSLAHWPLPGRARIEPLARRYHELLAAGPVRGVQAQTELVRAALGDRVLGPLEGRLTAKRLLVVAHGALEYVPFAALPLPGDASARPLLAAHELVSLPSAASLRWLRHRLATRLPPPGQVAVVADPVYGRDDPRVAAAAAGEVGLDELASFPPGPLSRPLPRLLGTRREAERILAFASPAERFSAVGFDASRETVLGDQLARYRIVHFATHGLLDAEHPELSGLVLTQVDRAGRQRPGILWSHEIPGLQLPVELVVLSACRTALGREIRGEGLTGLTRGFLDAGAARVVVTLWSVGDEATGELMERFYDGVLLRHLPAAAALRRAQLGLASDPRWHHPSNWAGFVLQGEWR
jgi:CHAT domain-containing protein